MEGYISTIIVAVIPSILSAMILAKLNKHHEKLAMDERERDEREELILESIDATFDVAKELVNCVLYNKKPNGELEECLKRKDEVRKKLEKFERKRASR